MLFQIVFGNAWRREKRDAVDHTPTSFFARKGVTFGHYYHSLLVFTCILVPCNAGCWDLLLFMPCDEDVTTLLVNACKNGSWDAGKVESH
jgi:hypothetical protein